MMKRYRVRFDDGGSWFWDCYVAADSIDEVIEIAREDVESGGVPHEVYEDEGSCKPDNLVNITELG